MCGPDATRESYEAVPYERLVHRFTHPDRIAVAVRLAGLDPPPVGTARVLELGCASGDNLVGMACGLPGGSFVGVDLSERQVAAGRSRVVSLGLANVDLRAGDLGDVDGGWGEFDYVVAHGVLSWVGEPVRRRLLEVCAERLSPRGIAFVSWNALPGWRFRALVRDVLLSGAATAESPSERAARARERLAFVAENVFEPESPWGRYLAERSAELAGESDADLLHDYLEGENQAFGLREVVGIARAAGLAFVGDAQEPWVPDEALPPGALRALEALEDPVAREELLDLLRERTLRQGLFVRSDVAARPVSAAGRALLTGLHAAAPPASGAAGDPGPETPLAPLLALLRAAWPATVPVVQVAARLHGSGTPASEEGLALELARLQKRGLVELRTLPLSCGAPESPKPRASALARLQAGEARVTSLRHRNVELDPLAAAVLVLLDGSRTVPEAAAACGWPLPLVQAVVGRLLADSLLEG